MDKLSKQPYEKFSITVDFSEVLTAGEIIVGQTVLVFTSTGADVTDAMIASGTVGNADSGVVAMIQGGEPADSPHKITARCETAIGHRWEHDVQLMVRDL